MKKQHILIGESDRNFAEQLTEALKSEGFMVEDKPDWDSVYTKMLNCSPTLILVNKSLPGMSIWDAIREVKSSFDGYLVLLSDEDSDLDQILAIELGADDFIVKPIHLRLLMARIHALLRRTSSEKSRTHSVSIGDLTVDASRREAYLGGDVLDLTTIQFDLLWYLVSNAGSVVSRDDLCKAVREIEYDGINRSIDVYVSRIRKKLGDDPSNPCFLKTVRGTGYLFAGEKIG